MEARKAFDEGQRLAEAVRYAEAVPLIERALELSTANHGEAHPEVARCLDLLGNTRRQQGDFARAEPLLQRGLAIREAVYGKHHPDVARSLHNLAYLHYFQGLYARAEPLYERALAIQEATLGAHHPDVARSLRGLAILYKARGHHARAKSLYERALATQEATLGAHHPDVAELLNSLALLHEEQGDHARAQELHERALAIRKAALGKDHPYTAESLDNVASLYSSQGAYARAEPLLQHALAIREAVYGKHHPDVARSLQSLASLHYFQGNHARAEPLYQRALELQEAALGTHHLYVAESLYYLARLRLAQQRLAEALPLFERAFAISEAHLRQEVFSFSEERTTSVLHLLRAYEECLYALVRAHPDDARVRDLVLTTVLLRKSRSVEEVADTSRIIYRSLNQADRETFERLRTLRTQLATLSLAGPASLPPADYRQRLKVLADQGDDIEANLARRSAPLRSRYAPPPPEKLIGLVAQSLPRNSVLVEFVAYRDSPLVPSPGTPPSRTPSEPRYLALLLFADGGTRALDLGPAASIDDAAVRLHAALADSTVAYRPAAQALYTRVFRPLLPLLGEVRHLFLSLDGQLALVPFAALHDGHHFLLDDWDITYLTSGKALLPRAKEAPPARSVVILANPEFGSSPVGSLQAARATQKPSERSASFQHFFTRNLDLADQPWPPLPGAEEEAYAIKRLLPQAELLLGRAATKDALLKLAAPGILHIATHGFFLGDASVSEDTRAVGYFGAVGDKGPRHLPSHPLLRSGLVLASARTSEARPGAVHRGDLIVTALELAGLDLWGTQLVVLSGCDTGRGDVKLGQGVYGLRHALLVAGAETMVTSLWKINDDTTRQLMESYYHHLLAGQGRSSALRRAMRALRARQPHPHFWAPFIAIGQDAPLRGLAPLPTRTPRRCRERGARTHLANRRCAPVPGRPGSGGPG
ncbi:MAG TPA: CHAT domain-containing tetratricopeptide repeat protein [Archangium sp.]|uniref:CHAT domain-containing tetratricopeptide repeat protein n=1 Tax=Archangium sp. TaxID=1872627 RepID=UPI002ED7DC61